MAERDEMISQFKDVTGVDTERAQFYLESTAWQLDVAISSFYERDEDLADPQRPEVEELPVTNNISETASRSAGSLEKMSSKSKPKSRSKFGTLQDLQNKESSSDEEEGQAFYAGGSTNSGQQVLGPGKKKDKDKNKKDIINDMFKSCQEQAVPYEENKPSNTNRPSTFKGTGYKLGMTSNDTEVISPPQVDRRPSTGIITLKLWQNGFTINDREIRLYDDPENQEFLETIKRGEIPQEIRQEIQGGEVGLNMEDHRHEEYVPPKVQVKAFSGKGQMLGSPSPAAAGMTIPVDPSDQAANEALAQKQLNIDNTQPITTLQIRLADGSNVRVQFNLTHTIEDIRRYITTMRPQYALREFILQTTYPTKELAEEKKTIQEANLQNSAIMQRLK